VRDLLGEDAGAGSDVTHEGDVADALIGRGVLYVESNRQRARLLGILFDVPGTLQHLNVVGHGGR